MSDASNRVKSHNERLKRQMAREETAQTDEVSRARKSRQKWILAGLCVTLTFLVWRAFQPTVQREKPPADLVLSDLHEVLDSAPPRIRGRVQNNTSRSVKRAVWLVTYPDVRLPIGRDALPFTKDLSGLTADKDEASQPQAPPSDLSRRPDEKPAPQQAMVTEVIFVEDLPPGATREIDRPTSSLQFIGKAVPARRVVQPFRIEWGP